MSDLSTTLINMIKDNRIPKTALNLYVVILENTIDNSCSLTNKQLAEILEIGPTVVFTSLKLLEEFGYLDKQLVNNSNNKRRLILTIPYITNPLNGNPINGKALNGNPINGNPINGNPINGNAGIPTKTRRTLSKNDENQKNDYICFNSTNDLNNKNQNQNINSKSKDIARDENLSRNQGDKKPKVDKQSKLDIQKNQTMQLLEKYSFGEPIDIQLAEFIENTYVIGKPKSVKAVDTQLMMLKELKATDDEKIALIRATISKDWASLTYEIEAFSKSKGTGYGARSNTTYDTPSMVEALSTAPKTYAERMALKKKLEDEDDGERY